MKQILDFKELANTTSLGLREDKKQGIQYTEIAKDGIYYTFDNGVMTITEKQHEIPQGVLTGMVLPTIEEGFALKERVPFSFFLKILQFYYDVNREYQTEVSAIIYRNLYNVELPQDLKDEYGDAYYEEDGFVLVVPKQTNSSARSQFAHVNKELSDPLFEWCESNLIGVAETHSHNTMGAFWSGTDDAYEKHNKLRMFMVIGQLGHSQKPTYKVRYCFNQKYTDNLDLGELFEVPTFTMGVHMSEPSMGNIFKQEPTIIPVRQAIESIDLESSLIDYPKQDWMDKLLTQQEYNASKGIEESTYNYNYQSIQTGLDLDDEEDESSQDINLMPESSSEDLYQQGMADFIEMQDDFNLSLVKELIDLDGSTDTKDISVQIDTIDLEEFYLDVMDDMVRYDTYKIEDESYGEGFSRAVKDYLDDTFSGVSYKELEELLNRGADASSFNDDLEELRFELEDAEQNHGTEPPSNKEDLIDYITSTENKNEPEPKKGLFGYTKKDNGKAKTGFFSL